MIEIIRKNWLWLNTTLGRRIIQDMKRDITKKLYDLILSRKGDFTRLARSIWLRPELGFEEKFACAEQKKLLSGLGFAVKSPFGGIKTAYKAVRGSGKPSFCFVAEYDALPGIGHGCGHNLICAAAIAAGWAVATMLEKKKLAGTVIVMGTPGEEGKGGKVIMLKNNALKGVDAAMMTHPSWETMIDTASTAIRRLEVSFTGKAAHAAAHPDLGVNALDAVMLIFNGINAWRQHLPESSRVHGIIIKGGEMPNIIPDNSTCCFYLRSPDDAYLDKMERRFRDIVKGAALMTGAIPKIKNYNIPYKSRRPNAVLNTTYSEAADILGLKPTAHLKPGRGSSDFGDFSHAVPGIHPYFGIAKKKIAGHSLDFTKAAGSDYGMKQMLKAAAAMASTGYFFITDKKFRKQVLG